MHKLPPLTVSPDLEGMIRQLVLRHGFRDVLKALQAEAQDPARTPAQRAKARAFLLRILQQALTVLSILLEPPAPPPGPERTDHV